MEKLNTKFSIIIPTFNEEKNILKTLKSIYNSICKNINNYEIIIVDSNSKDKTVKIVKEYLNIKKIKYSIVLNETQVYPGKARNIGIKKAQYENLILIDCGITIKEDFINEINSKIRNYDVIWFKPIFEFNETIQRAFVRAYFRKKEKGRYIRHCAINKRVFKECGIFREDLRAAEDWLFYMEIDKINIKEYFSDIEASYSGYPKTFKEFYYKWKKYFEHSVYAKLHKKNIIFTALNILMLLVLIVISNLFITILLSIIISIIISFNIRLIYSIIGSKIKLLNSHDYINTIIANTIFDSSRITGILKGKRNGSIK